MSRRIKPVRWVDPQDFKDARREVRMTRVEAAKALDVTPRTIQNWETGGARIPWMAMRMLRILRGHALPGHDWEGWTVRGDTIYAPNGHGFDAARLQYLQPVFSMAKLWSQMYTRQGRAKTASTVIPFPDLRRSHEDAYNPLAERLQQQGGKR